MSDSSVFTFSTQGNAECGADPGDNTDCDTDANSIPTHTPPTTEPIKAASSDTPPTTIETIMTDSGNGSEEPVHSEM